MDTSVISSELELANLSAQQEFFAEHGEPMYCEMLMELGFKKSWQPKTMQFWIGQKVGNHGQSMDIKIAGAQAMVEVLEKYGIKASYRCRAD